MRKVVIPTRNAEAARLVEKVFKCKWTVSVLELIGQGIYRPGQMKKTLLVLLPSFSVIF